MRQAEANDGSRQDLTTQQTPGRLTSLAVATEGKTKKEIMRCLKRYIAREVHASLRADLAALPPT